MITVNATVQFTADDRADAEAKIESWRLHEGCTVTAHLHEILDAHETVEGSAGELSRKPTADEQFQADLEAAKLEAAETAGDNGN